MHICPSCGTGFQDDEEFCLDCGLKLTTGETPGDAGDSSRTAPSDARFSAEVHLPEAGLPGARSSGSPAATSTSSVQPPAGDGKSARTGASGGGSTRGGRDTKNDRASRSGQPAVPSAPSGHRKSGGGKASGGKVMPEVGRAKAGASAGKLGRAGSDPTGRPSTPPATGRPARVRQPDPTTDRLMRYRAVYKAPDEYTAVTIKELLRSAGLSATMLPVAEPTDDGIDRLIEGYWGKVLVLESDIEDACRLIGDYLRGLDRSMH